MPLPATAATALPRPSTRRGRPRLSSPPRLATPTPLKRCSRTAPASAFGSGPRRGGATGLRRSTPPSAAATSRLRPRCSSRHAERAILLTRHTAMPGSRRCIRRRSTATPGWSRSCWSLAPTPTQRLPTARHPLPGGGRWGRRRRQRAARRRRRPGGGTGVGPRHPASRRERRRRRGVSRATALGRGRRYCGNCRRRHAGDAAGPRRGCWVIGRGDRDWRKSST